MTVAIVDSGVANLASVLAALKRLKADAQVTKDAEAIRRASHVILPGVGSAPAAMDRLNAYNLSDVLRRLSQPVLGICLGMQMLFSFSDEGEGCACLGVIPGRIKLLKPKNLSVPHMGWNAVDFRKNSPLFHALADQSYFYFVHSFAADVSNNALATCAYGDSFTAVAQYKNFFGCQFHPERSSHAGALLLKNFLEM